MTDQLPSDSLSAPSEQFVNSTRQRSCLIAAISLALLALIGVAGFFWVATLYNVFSQQLFGSVLAADIARASIYGLALLIPSGFVALLVRNPRFSLWRGISLAIAVGSTHALIAGLLLAVDRKLIWPGIPDAIPPLLTLIFAFSLILLDRRCLWVRPTWTVWLGLGLGFFISLGWIGLGALGTPSELALAILEATANAFLSAALMVLIFAYDPGTPIRRPFLSGLLAGALLMALEFSFFAVRGWWIQGAVLSLAFLPVSLIAGLLLTLDAHPSINHSWWAALAFLFPAFLIPFAFTEGLEGDLMQDELIPVWINGLLVIALLALLCVIVVLAAHSTMLRLSEENATKRHPILTILSIVVLVLSLGLGIAVYATAQPGIQSETFFVVMADQAETTFARNIQDRDERMQAVYDTLTEHALMTQSDLRAFLDRRGVIYTPYYLVNGIEVEGDPLLRQQIAAREDVDYILNSPHTRPLPQSSKAFGIPSESTTHHLPTGVDEMNAELVWQQLGITGEGIVVGQADTGVDWTHPALRGAYLGSEDQHNYTWFDPWENTPEPVDRAGHGTHTLGTVLGEGIGVAPGAKWIGCRNLARNLGNPGYYLDCMQFLFAPFPQNGEPLADGEPSRGAHVTNNAWGCPPQEGCDLKTFSIAVQNLRNAGQMFVVSAGNDGPGCSTIWAPANAEAAVTVGAIDPLTLEIAYFSSRGPIVADGSGRIKPDVVAPGVNILSSVPGGGYVEVGMSGTSMATPHITGLVALLWSANPDLISDIDATEQIIIETAHPGSTQVSLCGDSTDTHNNVYGYGSVDALAAVRAAMERP